MATRYNDMRTKNPENSIGKILDSQINPLDKDIIKTITITNNINNKTSLNKIMIKITKALVDNNVYTLWQRRIYKNIRKYFIKYLRDGNTNSTYTEWLITKYPRLNSIKSGDAYQIEHTKHTKKNTNKKINNKYSIAGTGRVDRFLIDGNKFNIQQADKMVKQSKLKVDKDAYEYVLKIKLFKGTYNEN